MTTVRATRPHPQFPPAIPGALRRAFAILLAVLVIVTPAAQPCSVPCAPGTSKAVYLVPGSLQPISALSYAATIRVVGYKTVAGNGVACSCGLHLKQSSYIKSLTAVRMMFTGTSTPVPGFNAFAANAVSTSDWAAALAGGTWKAFVTPATSTLPGGTLVDFEFDVTFELPRPTHPDPSVSANSASAGFSAATGAGPGTAAGFGGTLGYAPHTNPKSALAEALGQGAIGTDEATITGALTGHITAIESFLPLALAPADSWSDLGGGLAGTTGIPKLQGAGELALGHSAQLILTNAKPASMATLLIGTVQVSLPFKGGILLVAPGVVDIVLPTGNGSVSLPLTNLNLPPGASFFAQAVVVDSGAVQGCSISNAVKGLFH